MTRNRSTSVASMLLGFAALTGCWTSPPPSEFPQAHSSRGTAGILFLANGRAYSAELLSVRDSSILVLIGDRIGVAYFRDISGVSFAQFTYGEPGLHEWPSPTTLQRGREASRFPFGIGEPVMRALLERRKQTAPDNLILVRQ